MRITFSRRGDYAVRAMLALAEHELPGTSGALRAASNGPGNGYLSARRIAERMHIPGPFAAHVLADLMRAGLVRGSAGRAGGYRLADRAEDITLLRVVDAAEGTHEPPRCVLRGMPCDPNGRCAVHDTVTGATAAARAALERTSLAELVHRPS